MKIGKKAFTLIELMIVVVILGVLMSTVLPKLTGAQARSRDAGRIADLGNIAAALQVFYDDNGYYPTTTTGSSVSDEDTDGYCLGSGTGVALQISGYMQSQKVPVDPQPTANKFLCGPTPGTDSGLGRYYYSALMKNGLNRNSYILCADMETLQKANTNAADVHGGSETNAETTTNASVGNESDTSTTGTTYEDLLNVVGIKVGENKLTGEPDNNAGQSVFCILRP